MAPPIMAPPPIEDPPMPMPPDMPMPLPPMDIPLPMAPPIMAPPPIEDPPMPMPPLMAPPMAIPPAMPPAPAPDPQSVPGGQFPAGLATTVYTGICLVTILVTGTHRVRTWVSNTVRTRSSTTTLDSVTVENLVSLRLTVYGTRTFFCLLTMVVFISVFGTCLTTSTMMVLGCFDLTETILVTRRVTGAW